MAGTTTGQIPGTGAIGLQTSRGKLVMIDIPEYLVMTIFFHRMAGRRSNFGGRGRQNREVKKMRSGDIFDDEGSNKLHRRFICGTKVRSAASDRVQLIRTSPRCPRLDQILPACRVSSCMN